MWNNSRASSSNTQIFKHHQLLPSNSNMFIRTVDCTLWREKKIHLKAHQYSAAFLFVKRESCQTFRIYSHLIFVRCSKQEQRYFNRNGVHTHSSSVYDQRASAVPVPHLIPHMCLYKSERTCCVHILLRPQTNVTHPPKKVHQKQAERPSKPAHPQQTDVTVGKASTPPRCGGDHSSQTTVR